MSEEQPLLLIRRSTSPGHALAWIDDAHDDACRAWASARPGATLLVETDPRTGLTAEQGDELRAWAG